MNIRPTVDFDDKYLNAKCKVIECIKAATGSRMFCLHGDGNVT